MSVPTGNIQVQPAGNDGKLAKFRVTTTDSMGTPLISKENWEIRLLGPHYYHPALLKGYKLFLPSIGVTMTAKGNRIVISWNGIAWGIATVDPRSGPILSFQNKTSAV